MMAIVNVKPNWIKKENKETKEKMLRKSQPDFLCLC